MVVLKLFGGVCLEGDTGVMRGAAAQRHRLALLALLATARSHTLPREKLMELLWPEREDEHVRNLLKQSVVVQCDVNRFQRAIASGDFATAVSFYAGPFLDGFFLGAASADAPWLAGIFAWKGL